MLASWKPPCFTVVLVLVPFWNSEHIWQAEYVEKLEPGLHSTKGIGKTEPDPAGSKELDGCKVILKKWTCHTSWTPPRWKYEGLQQRKPCRCLRELAWRTAAGRQTCCTTSTSSMMSPRYSFYIQKIRWKAVDTSQMPPPHHSPHAFPQYIRDWVMSMNTKSCRKHLLHYNQEIRTDKQGDCKRNIIKLLPICLCACMFCLCFI